jgi:hypothetical protein
MDHEVMRGRDEAPSEFVEDRCPGCGAEWVGHASAFACGHPLADCPAQIEADERWREQDALEAEEAAFASLVVDVCETGSDADVLAMDELEEELDARLAAFHGPDTDVQKDDTDVQKDDTKIDIPF